MSDSMPIQCQFNVRCLADSDRTIFFVYNFRCGEKLKVMKIKIVFAVIFLRKESDKAVCATQIAKE
jgi:hypothetical protein